VSTSRESKGRQQSAFSSPVLVGAITVLVVLVGVFLAYNANVGLPFVPTREIRVDLADGSDLVVGNDVLESGFRIGFVEAMKPITLGNGTPGVQLMLRLNETNGKIPTDSTATILSRSPLGLKYVDIHTGTSTRYFADGGTLPFSQTTIPVRLDQIYDGYTPPTRSAIRQNLVGYGDVLAGRGSALNDTIAALPSLFGHLAPVARYLSDPSTELIRFFNALNGFTSAVAPVAQQNAQLFADMATTFQAISANAADLENTIALSPSTLQTSTRSLIVQQPFLVNFTKLGNALRPATVQLREALPSVNPALEAGTRTLIRTPSLDAKLQQVMVQLQRLAQSPGTGMALNGLTDTVDTLNPVVKYLGPYVTVCNYWNYWWNNLGDVFSAATNFGYAQRALLNTGNPAQPNNVGSAGATAPANGGAPTTATGANEFAHGPAYGAAVDNQGNADCETGQRGYPLKLNGLDPQGRLLDTDPHTPGDQGSTYTGAGHVPKGETFTRSPTTGPVPVSPASNQ
jgi:virulence factor Mce-like protein